jgi:hypothetical protein
VLGTQTWRGPFAAEAAYAYQRARLAGLSEMRARMIGHIASYRETWAFASSIASWVNGSRRTVFRALAQAKAEGLIGSRPIKDDEIPPGAEKPISCGGSLRWTIGWGKAVEEAKAAVAHARMRWLIRVSNVAKHVAKPPKGGAKSEPTPGPHTRTPGRAEYRRPMTAEEIDRALASEPFGDEPPPE